jgi:hypothetical protein
VTRYRIGLAALAVPVVAGMAVAAGRISVAAPRKPPAATAAPNLVGFRDDRAGWSIAYPRTWNRLQSKDADVVLIASEKPPEVNNGGSILGRVVTLPAPVDDATLPAAREITDRIVNGEGVELLAQPAVVHQGGLPGYFYFYRFRDAATGQEGVHSHYFLFNRATMISLVFQALPKESFKGLANVYDDVIGSFRVLKESADAAG